MELQSMTRLASFHQDQIHQNAAWTATNQALVADKQGLPGSMQALLGARESEARYHERSLAELSRRMRPLEAKAEL
jgi:hypothetical protein